MLAFELIDVGATMASTAALVVVTPGVQSEAYLPWAQALEDAGLDAWLVRFPAPEQSVDGVIRGVQQAYETLSEDRQVVVAAHGYGGAFVILSGISPQRMALVGVPLGPHAMPPVMGPPPKVVAEAMPCATELPLEPYSAELALAYRAWTRDFPVYEVPANETLLIASGMDCVAPPETVRLPSQDWPQRTWERTGLLGLGLEELDHAALLSDEQIARRVAHWLAR